MTKLWGVKNLYKNLMLLCNRVTRKEFLLSSNLSPGEPWKEGPSVALTLPSLKKILMGHSGEAQQSVFLLNYIAVLQDRFVI